VRCERLLAVTKRLADLVSLVQAGTYSSGALAQKLRVSEQTVYRDILFLKQRGHSIRSVNHGSYWAYEIDAETERRPGAGVRG
jgi:DeoR/GlpR family transcriptional regulator of sugar metabolism